jgi:hypothetical protein
VEQSAITGPEQSGAGEVHGFPAALTSFIGRDAVVREVAGLLGEHRLHVASELTHQRHHQMLADAGQRQLRRQLRRPAIGTPNALGRIARRVVLAVAGGHGTKPSAHGTAVRVPEGASDLPLAEV